LKFVPVAGEDKRRRSAAASLEIEPFASGTLDRLFAIR